MEEPLDGAPALRLGLRAGSSLLVRPGDGRGEEDDGSEDPVSVDRLPCRPSSPGTGAGGVGDGSEDGGVDVL